jgi:hypothetical protein
MITSYIFIIFVVMAGIITPMNTNNPVSTEPYCGFGERDNCETIPQNTPISINDIQRLEL